MKPQKRYLSTQAVTSILVLLSTIKEYCEPRQATKTQVTQLQLIVRHKREQYFVKKSDQAQTKINRIL